jgi:ABC-2 type transport system ATP-binding protein
MNIIESKNLDFGFDKPVFSKANFNVLKKSITGVIGSNGAGKTTLFDLICGVRVPEGGALDIHTENPAYLSQTVSTPPSLKMGDLFNLVSTLVSDRSINGEKAADEFRRWHPALADRFERISSRRPSQCSYGEIRYYFALTLLLMPNELILLDEPTAGVDPEHRYYIWKAISAARAKGKTIVISSHNLHEIVEYTDIFWFINNREIISYDSKQAFLQAYRSHDLDQAFINACHGV